MPYPTPHAQDSWLPPWRDCNFSATFLVQPLPPSAIILPILSPYTKYSIMINKATPYTYPVPLRDDGNMPDVPSHPQDPQGPSLEWLKKL
uniref:NADH dehydrogenase [ubiquinone] 1 alpha subcomplex subunit 3 n=1 Tax=Equus caballus TaxID=9796 RepID=A0A9L0SG51_HORSE